MARKQKSKPTIQDSLGRVRSATRSDWGKIRALPSGRLQASYVNDEVRYTAPMTFDNETDAKQWLASTRSEIVRGTWLSPAQKAAKAAAAASHEIAASRTLGDYAQSWLKARTNARGEHLRPRTLEEYKRMLRTPGEGRANDDGGPLAELAVLPLSQISPEVVRSWRSRLLATGKQTTASRAYGLLNAIMHTAASEDKLIDENPCMIRGGQATKTGRKVAPPADETELRRLIAALPERHQTMAITSAATGLRWGELTELRAGDVEILHDAAGAVDGVKIVLTRAVTRTGAGFNVGPPKSAAGVRTVFVFGLDGAIIAAHVQKRAAAPGQLLFPAEDGTSHLAQSTFHRHWDAARRTVGRPDMPWHALRHWRASENHKDGATGAENMALLGQSTLSVNLGYIHAQEARLEEIARRSARRE